jgi:hypothetical protein
MNRKHPWFKLWATDFLCDPDVDELPLEAQALLVRMWCVCNQSGSLPDDVEEVARLTRCRLSSCLLSYPLCKRFFESRGGLLFSNRMEAEKLRSEVARTNAGKRLKKVRTGESNIEASSNCSTDSITQRAREPDPHTKTPTPIETFSLTSSEGAGELRESSEDVASNSRRKAKVADPRSAAFHAALKKHWEATCPGVPFVWDGSEGKALSMLLAASPALDLQSFCHMLDNRMKSNGLAHSKRPREWIGTVTKFATGPLDKFGHTKEIHAGNQDNRSPAVRRVAQSVDAFRKAAERDGG